MGSERPLSGMEDGRLNGNLWGRLQTGGFMTLDRLLLSDPDVRVIKRERQMLAAFLPEAINRA
jgi:hypothetical protein